MIQENKEPKPEETQRKELGNRVLSMEETEGMIGTLRRGLPVGFAVTEVGTNLMEALQNSLDFITNSKRIIAGETRPVDEGKK